MGGRNDRKGGILRIRAKNSEWAVYLETALYPAQYDASPEHDSDKSKQCAKNRGIVSISEAVIKFVGHYPDFQPPRHSYYVVYEVLCGCFGNCGYWVTSGQRYCFNMPTPAAMVDSAKT